MGNSSSSEHLGKKSSAKEVVEKFGTGNYLNGKVAIVTGGNSGIGLETVKALASAGAKVILCSRSVSAGCAAIESEVKQMGEGLYIASHDKIVVKELDLMRLDSIRTLAEDVLANEERIDFLVLNAGIMALPNLEYTDAGFEKQIGVNHFGHFYLTSLLLPKMKSQTFPSRIVVLSSTAHTMGDVVPSDLNFKNGRQYSAWGAYGQSKLANLLFAKSLADKLKDTPIRTASVHPGVIQTALWRQSFFAGLLAPFIADKTIPQGAATTLYGCLSPTIENEDNGAYLADCARAQPNAAGQDEGGKLREELWTTTETLLAEALNDKK